MNITNTDIDGGKPFDWGRISSDYAKFRDIYPEKFYNKIIRRGLCTKGKNILDIGTGTGVLPRNMYGFGAKWIGTDISPEQILQARRLSKGMDINYLVSSAEDIVFPDNSFDVVTACQCFWYFKHNILIPKLFNILKPGGRILILYMAWLPFEDKIANASEQLILKYSPKWSGAGETVHPITIPDCCLRYFDRIYNEEYKLKVHFTRSAWNGRVKTCRGIGASLSPEDISKWEQEHIRLLAEIAPDEFDVLHYAAIAELKVKK